MSRTLADDGAKQRKIIYGWRQVNGEQKILLARNVRELELHASVWGECVRRRALFELYEPKTARLDTIEPQTEAIATSPASYSVQRKPGRPKGFKNKLRAVRVAQKEARAVKQGTTFGTEVAMWLVEACIYQLLKGQNQKDDEM